MELTDDLAVRRVVMGASNHIFDEAIDTQCVLFHEAPDHLQRQQGSDLQRRELESFYRDTFKAHYGEELSQQWLTIYLKNPTNFRTAGPCVFITKKNGEIWWTLVEENAPAEVFDRRFLYDIAEYDIGRIRASVPWRNTTLRGELLEENRVHPYFWQNTMIMRATLSTMSDENAAYTRALLRGEPLDTFHQSPDYKAKENRDAAPFRSRQEQRRRALSDHDLTLDDMVEIVQNRGPQGRSPSLYMITSPKHRKFTKIGYTYDVAQRLKELRTGNPFPLEVLAEFPCRVGRYEEILVHDLLQTYRVVQEDGYRSEWFTADPAEIRLIIEKVIGEAEADLDTLTGAEPSADR